VFMVDPPYLTDVRCDSRGMYAHEMGSEAEHEELLDALTSCRGKVLLCGYRSGLYDRRLKAWARTDLPARASSGAARVESVWTNYRPERQPGLWEASGGGHRGPPLLPEDPGGGPVHTAGPVRRAARRHLQLADPRPLPEPIVYRGGQGLRRLDPT
jgi:hypothetical protein